MAEPRIEEKKCWMVTEPGGLRTYKFLCEGEKAYWVGDPSVGIFGADVRIRNVFKTPGGLIYAEIEFEDGTTDEVPISMIKSHEDLLQEKIAELSMGMDFWEDKYKECKEELERCSRK